MKTRLFLARVMALAFVAGGIAASLPTEAMAANRTWTNASSTLSGNKNKWGTTAQYSTNWSANLNPTSLDTAVFTGAQGITQVNTIISNNTPVGQLTFGGTTAYTFQKNSTTGSLLISGNGGLPNLGIVNSSSAKQTFDAGVKLGASNVEFRSTGSGNSALRFTALDVGTGRATVTNNAEVVGLVGSASGSYEAKGSGLQAINFAIGSTVGGLIVSGGNVTSDGDSANTSLDVSGGNYVGGGVFKDVEVTSGNLDLSGLASMSTSTAGTGYQQSGSGITKMDVGWDADNMTTFGSSVNVNTGGFTLGGGLSLDGAGLGTASFAPGTTWNLFQGTNFTSGSASPENNPSNFSQFALSNAADSPYNGAFTKVGPDWVGTASNDGSFLVFQAATGNLVVVPEPSTIVFAGLGVAMSGWTMWKKRRLSRLLAAKAG